MMNIALDCFAKSEQHMALDQTMQLGMLTNKWKYHKQCSGQYRDEHCTEQSCKSRAIEDIGSDSKRKNDKLLPGRACSVWTELLFNSSAFAVQPLIVVQGPYIQWSQRRFACVGTLKHSGEEERSSVPHIETLRNQMNWIPNNKTSSIV
eukprot:11233951-Heterocapsa_arctica.AAC.1